MPIQTHVDFRRDDPEVNRAQFVLKANSPFLWNLMATQLSRAATHLWNVASKEDRRRSRQAPKRKVLKPGSRAAILAMERHADRTCFDSYLLLSGLAVEAALKGLYAAQGNKIVVSDGKVSRLCQDIDMTHDLIKLADSCALAVTAEDRVMLFMLSEFVRWRGKYPVPVLHTHMNRRPPRISGKHRENLMAGEDAVNLIEGIYRKIEHAQECVRTTSGNRTRSLRKPL